MRRVAECVVYRLHDAIQLAVNVTRPEAKNAKASLAEKVVAPPIVLRSIGG